MKTPVLAGPPVDADAPGPTAGTTSRRGWRKPLTVSDVLAASWMVLLVLSMFFLPMILGLDDQKMNGADRLSGPSAAHWLGADNYGRDLLARALSGARVSLLIGFGSVLAAAVIGVPFGMLAGYLGRRTDAVISFVVDVLLAFPGLVLALALAALLGPSIQNVMIAIIVPMAPVFARLAKAQTLSVAQREYVQASRVIGTPTSSILRRDVFPNILQAMMAFALVSVGHAILIEGSLSFLGLGVPSPQPSWGSMINYGRSYITSDVLIILVPSLFMLFTILSLNLLADRYMSSTDTLAGAMR
jgi:peptide/nickel transport system permease protein